MTSPVPRRRRGRNSWEWYGFWKATAVEYGKFLGKGLAVVTLVALLVLGLNRLPVGVTIGRGATPVVPATRTVVVTVTPTPMPTVTATPIPTATPSPTPTPLPSLPGAGAGGVALGSRLGIAQPGVK